MRGGEGGGVLVVDVAGGGDEGLEGRGVVSGGESGVGRGVRTPGGIFCPQKMAPEGGMTRGRRPGAP